MKKRLFTQIVLLTFISIFLVASILSAIFYNQLTTQVCTDLRLWTEVFQAMDSKTVLEILPIVEPEDMRVTLIAGEGIVQYDNMADPKNLELHLGREEIEEALSLGEGDSYRFSATLDTKTYYYAIKLTDGLVLRTAKTVSSIWSMFMGALPIAFGAVCLYAISVYFISKQLINRVIKPIDNLDFTGVPNVPYDELIPFAKTITEHRKQIAQDNVKLREHADTVNAIMDNMEEGVVILDKDSVILSLNKSVSDIFSITLPMTGRHVLELLRKIEFQKSIRSALQGNQEEILFSKDHKDYRVFVSPVAQTGVILLFLDITKKTDVEKMRREFSANVSHELKTPLTSISGNAEMLMVGVVKEEDKPIFYSKIMNEASRLITLIEDIIMLSELDEDKVRESFESVNLAEIASDCIEALEQKSIEHQVSIKISGTGKMEANRSLIREMFFNLIDNAIKYNKPKGQVSISISQAEEKIIIDVSDNGIGISETDQNRIFERFYRVDKSRSKKSGGTGLGLAIVKHVTMIHRGTISVTSTPGVGTAFQIELPGQQSQRRLLR